jgi:hypothetical protein
MKRRPCAKCGRNRAEKFYVSPRGRVCSTCRKRRTQHASRDVRLQEAYGITQQDYDAILAIQDGVCAICQGRRRGNLDVDHDHALEKLGVPPRDCVRGLLCRRCNRRLLPAATDKVANLYRAIDYLTFPPAQAVLSATTLGS